MPQRSPFLLGKEEVGSSIPHLLGSWGWGSVISDVGFDSHALQEARQKSERELRIRVGHTKKNTVEVAKWVKNLHFNSHSMITGHKWVGFSFKNKHKCVAY